MVSVSPLDYFSPFLNLLTIDTNRYTAQLLSTPFRPYSRFKNWKNRNNKEIKLYLDIMCGWN